MDQENKDLIKQIRLLNENIEVLTKVTALTLRKETLFKGTETKEEQIEKLEELQLPDRVIAIVIGSTPESVQSLRYQRKTKLKKKSNSDTSKEKVEKTT